MRRISVVVLFGLLLAVLLCARTAYADAAFPTIAWFVPPAWILLAPVIFIEAYVGTKWFAVPRRVALLASTASNITSSVAGIPLAWFGISLAGAAAYNHHNPVLRAVAQVGWLVWIPPGTHNYLSFFLGMGVFLLLSVALEYPMTIIFTRSQDKRQVFRWILVGNTLSYLLLTVLIVASMWSSVYVDKVVLPLAEAIEDWLSMFLKG